MKSFNSFNLEMINWMLFSVFIQRWRRFISSFLEFNSGALVSWLYASRLQSLWCSLCSYLQLLRAPQLGWYSEDGSLTKRVDTRESSRDTKHWKYACYLVQINEITIDMTLNLVNYLDFFWIQAPLDLFLPWPQFLSEIFGYSFCYYGLYYLSEAQSYRRVLG